VRQPGDDEPWWQDRGGWWWCLPEKRDGVHDTGAMTLRRERSGAFESSSEARWLPWTYAHEREDCEAAW
jgi:hypothetical protein